LTRKISNCRRDVNGGGCLINASKGGFVIHLTYQPHQPIFKTRPGSIVAKKFLCVGVGNGEKVTINNLNLLKVTMVLGRFLWPLWFHAEIIWKTIEVYKKMNESSHGFWPLFGLYLATIGATVF
jgi:hypothetical protein